MNKILIKDLLNNQNMKKDKNRITKINDILFEICSCLPNYGSNIPEDLLSSFDDIIVNLCGIKNDCKDINKIEGIKDLRITFQICCIMEQIIQHFPKEDLKGQLTKDTDTVIFNVMTQDMMNKKKTSLNSYRGHRFSSDNVTILEQWYDAHYQKPYLTKSSLEKLSKSTGLNKVQIRNWVSNRRRKEKSVQVSSVILDLVQEE